MPRTARALSVPTIAAPPTEEPKTDLRTPEVLVEAHNGKVIIRVPRHYTFVFDDESETAKPVRRQRRPRRATVMAITEAK